MAKISSRRQFNNCVDETYAKKVQYEVDSRHLKDAKADLGEREDAIIAYILADPDQDGGQDLTSITGCTDSVKYTLTRGRSLARLDGGDMNEESFLASLPTKYRRKVEVIAKDAIRADHLTEEKLAKLGLTYEITNNLKLTAIG